MVSGDSSQNRVFHYAVLASLVLHGLLLFGIPDLIDTARRVAALPQPLIARLMAPEAVAVPPPPLPAAEEKVEKKIERTKPPPRLVKPVPAPAPTPTPTPLPTPRVEQPAPPVESPQPPAPVPAPPVVATAPQPASPSAQPSAPVAAAPESLSRDEYRLQLIDEARRHKRYPPVARENNWEGVVGISIAVAAGGRPTVTLKSSSGYEVIDRQALDMFRQAARAVPVPPALRGNAFALDLRIRYALED